MVIPRKFWSHELVHCSSGDISVVLALISRRWFGAQPWEELMEASFSMKSITDDEEKVFRMGREWI